MWRPLLGFRPATASTGRGPPPSGRSYERTRPLSPAGHPLRSDKLHRTYSFLRSAWERTSSTLCVVRNGRGASEAAVPTQSVGTRIVGGVSTPRDRVVGGVSTPRFPLTPRVLSFYHYNAYSPTMRRWRPVVRRRAMMQAMRWPRLVPRGSDASFFRHTLESCSVDARVRPHQTVWSGRPRPAFLPYQATAPPGYPTPAVEAPSTKSQTSTNHRMTKLQTKREACCTPAAWSCLSIGAWCLRFACHL